MLNRIIASFKCINHKLFISLLIMGLVPTIYTGDYSYSIAGQLSWVILIYEVINEAIILSLFYFVGKVVFDKKELTNRIKTGLLVTLLIYLVLSLLIIIFIKPLLVLMAIDASIIDASITYIRLETIANIFIFLQSFVLV